MNNGFQHKKLPETQSDVLRAKIDESESDALIRLGLTWDITADNSKFDEVERLFTYIPGKEESKNDDESDFQ